jgi:hypothetical protein
LAATLLSAKIGAMTAPSPTPPLFLLSLFDREQWCPVLQARFAVTDIDRLRAMLDGHPDDIDLDWIYYLDDPEAQALCEAFGIKLDWAALDFPDREFIVYRIGPIRTAPYLVHTGYELPLLLDGRKKLARFTEPYPPMSFPGEERFDEWVAAGRLHKEVELDPFGDGTTGRLGSQGTRYVYYTTKGEEWRVPAMKLVWKAGGWNEHFERLEGMLFGYEDWQNDWWIETGVTGGGFGGVRHCCAVDAKGLAWIAQAGYRALPPIDQPELVLDGYEPTRSMTEQMARLERIDAVAMAVFSVNWRVLDLFDAPGPPYRLPAARIPELNTLLLRPITIRPVQPAATD